LSIEENLRFAAVIADLATRLHRQGRSPVWLSSPFDDDAGEPVVAQIERMLSALLMRHGVWQNPGASAAGSGVAL
jgi:hypothetical protein